MQLTNYEAQLLRIIDRYVTRYMRKKMVESLRSSISKSVLMVEGRVVKAPAQARKQLQDFVPWLNSLAPPLRLKDFSGSITGIVSRAIYAKSCKVELEAACRDVIRMMQPDAAAISMECMLPPPRRARQQRIPRTPLEDRQARLQEKVKEWERKVKYATNKLKKYRTRAKRCSTLIAKEKA